MKAVLDYSFAIKQLAFCIAISASILSDVVCDVDSLICFTYNVYIFIFKHQKSIYLGQ